jgi:hypothetical protein
MYRFDAARTELAREFKARPFGEHSPDLQYLLNMMRTRVDVPFHVLIMTRPFEQWALAVLEPGGKTPPRLTNQVFHSLEEAEWTVFRLRWKELAGTECPVE